MEKPPDSVRQTSHKKKNKKQGQVQRAVPGAQIASPMALRKLVHFSELSFLLLQNGNRQYELMYQQLNFLPSTMPFLLTMGSRISHLDLKCTPL